jgi:hypothetical protein
VPPLEATPVEVFDRKIKTLAYRKDSQILEVAFKNGETWQLSGVSAETYDCLLHHSLSDFLKFIAHRYKAAPVRADSRKIVVPDAEPCPACQRPMTVMHRMLSVSPIRVLWHCDPCNQSLWRTYRRKL